MGKIVDLSKRADASTLSKSDIAALEGDVGYYSRMLDDDWYEEYDQYFDVSEVAAHHETLAQAIDDVEHGDKNTTEQALCFAKSALKRSEAALELHAALGGGWAIVSASTTLKRDLYKIRAAVVSVAKTWSNNYKETIPIFNYANTLVATVGEAVAWS